MTRSDPIVEGDPTAPRPFPIAPAAWPFPITTAAWPFPITVADDQRITPDARDRAMGEPKLRQWLDGLAAGHAAGAWTVSDVRLDRLVHGGSRLLFILAEASLRDPTGRSLPGIVFVRGDSVAILPVLTASDGPAQPPMTVLVGQARAAIGAPLWWEIPAGMIDDGQVHAKALDELAEEVGAELTLPAEHLLPLGTVAPSPGACDERIALFAAPLALPAATIAGLHDRATGIAGEREVIRTRLVTLDRAAALTRADAKSALALMRYALGWDPALLAALQRQVDSDG